MQPMALVLIGAAVVGLLALLAIVRRPERRSGPTESEFAVSTEGEKRCPRCGMGNLVTDARCISCGADLPG